MHASSVDTSLIADLAVSGVIVLAVLCAGRLHKVSGAVGRLLSGRSQGP